MTTRHQPPGWAAVATLRDDTQPHQIRITKPSHELYWSCTCQRQPDRTYRPLGNTSALTPDQVLAAHANHVAGAAA